MVYAEAPWTFKGRCAWITAVLMAVVGFWSIWLTFTPR
jgi:hypothetical protein